MVALSSNNKWLNMVEEEIIEPELPICDAHHHLWDRNTHQPIQPRYLLDEILEDVNCGHNIVSTVYIECGAMFKADGPEYFRPVGETEFVNGIAAMSASEPSHR
jgi:L-fuconolactonase